MNITEIKVSGKNYESLLPLINLSIRENKKVAIVGYVGTGKTTILNTIETVLAENEIPYVKYDELEESLPDRLPTDKVLLIDHPRMTMKEMCQYLDLDRQEKAIFIIGYNDTDPALNSHFDIRIGTYFTKDDHFCRIC